MPFLRLLRRGLLVRDGWTVIGVSWLVMMVGIINATYRLQLVSRGPEREYLSPLSAQAPGTTNAGYSMTLVFW